MSAVRFARDLTRQLQGHDLADGPRETAAPYSRLWDALALGNELLDQGPI